MIILLAERDFRRTMTLYYNCYNLHFMAPCFQMALSWGFCCHFCHFNAIFIQYKTLVNKQPINNFYQITKAYCYTRHPQPFEKVCMGYLTSYKHITCEVADGLNFGAFLPLGNNF